MAFLQKGKSLVLDSTVCQVNTRCHLPERLSLPMASDLALSTQPEDTPGAFVGGVDFKAARKEVQVRLEEHGLLLFAFQGKLYRYIERAILGAVSRHSGGSALALFCFARRMGCWLGTFCGRPSVCTLPEKGAIPGQPCLVRLGDQLLPQHHSARVR